MTTISYDKDVLIRTNLHVNYTPLPGAVSVTLSFTSSKLRRIYFDIVAKYFDQSSSNSLERGFVIADFLKRTGSLGNQKVGFFSHFIYNFNFDS